MEVSISVTCDAWLFKVCLCNKDGLFSQNEFQAASTKLFISFRKFIVECMFIEARGIAIELLDC